jgi:uncharacterized RDD family membrane protein YckC
MADSPANAPTNSATNQPSRTRVRGAGRFQDQLSEEYTIDTPENVTFGYEVAGIGSRFIAALIDSIILGALLLGLNLALIMGLAALAGDASALEQGLAPAEDDWVAGLVIALYALLNFGIMWGYYLLFEWLWHGQTIGKRSARIRVVRSDGAPVGFVPIAVRNLVRIVDFLPTGYAVGVITMFCNRQARRLGDFAAGTLVIKDQGELTLDALMTAVPTAAPTKLRTELPAESPPSELTPDQDWSGIRRLTAADYELVQETLARYRSGKLDGALLHRVAGAIATKLEHRASSQLDGQDRSTIGKARSVAQVAFLESVAAAYGRWVR